MAHDVFISHSERNKNVALAICAALESMKVRCWIAPRDIRPGEKFGAAIVNAIRNSRIMVVVFSADSNASEHVAREVERAVHSKLIIMPFKIDNVEPTPEMEYFLATSHWLDALSLPMEENIKKLADAVKDVLNAAEDMRENLAGGTAPARAQTLAHGTPLSANDASGLPAFRAKGIAAISLKDGQTLMAPANCMLYRDYSSIYAGLSVPPQPGMESMTAAFEEIQSIEMKEIAPYNHRAMITFLNGETAEMPVPGTLFAITAQGRTELSPSRIGRIAFDHEGDAGFGVRAAEILPAGGKPFAVPYDLLSVKVNSLGSGGFSTVWHDGLPLLTGNELPFKKMKAFYVTQSKSTGMNGWNIEAALRIELADGGILEEDLKLPSCFLTGMNKMGVFTLDFVQQLEGARFL